MDACVLKEKGCFLHVHPIDDGGEDFLLQLFLVPDEIVVYEEDLALEPCCVHTFDLPDNLVLVFCARRAAAEQGNITKLAVKGTAPGILDIDRGIVLHVNKPPERNGCLRYVCPLISGIEMTCIPFLEIC